MGCGASADSAYQVIDDELAGGKRQEVSPPAATLFRDFSSMLTLQFRGEGLNNGERSFLMVYTKAGDGLWQELGKTEVCSLDTTWPVWGHLMEVEFRVEVSRQIRCEVYKLNRGATLDDMAAHKFLGGCEFMLTEAVMARAKVSSSDGWLRKKLANIHRKRGEKRPGKICVFADEKQISKLELYFTMKADGLKSPDYWKRKPDPFFVVNRTEITGMDDWDFPELGLVPCFRSEVARKSTEPRFKYAGITAAQVCRGLEDQDVILTIEDWNRLSAPLVLGEAVTSFAELWKAAGERSVKLPICKRQGPRLEGLTKCTFNQIKRMRRVAGRREPRRTTGFAQLTRLGSVLSRATVTKSSSRSRSSSASPVPSKELRASPSKERQNYALARSSTLVSISKESNARSGGSEESGSKEAARQASKVSRASSRDAVARGQSLKRGASKTLSRSFSLRKTLNALTGWSEEDSTSQPGGTTLRNLAAYQSTMSMTRTNGTAGVSASDRTLFFGPVVGQLAIEQLILERSYTFLDYVRGGLELRMMLGIDFTRSNMDTMNPESLHSLCEKELATAYEDAICALGQVLRSYDTTGHYSVYGFGAKIPPSHTVCSNCFALTGDFLHPQVKGIDGILKAYRRALNIVHLHGPSDCGEVLHTAARFAKNYVQEPEKKDVLRSNIPPEMLYFVLLIFTDGEVESEKRIVAELRKMQEYPISVFFIGIGNKDFTFMRELPEAMCMEFDKDFEKPKLNHLSKKAGRRVARFVKYAEYETDHEGLVAATLAELPREIVLYYRMLGVKPRGLERFENKFGEPFPTPLPKAAKGELNLAKQRTADRVAREKVMATVQTTKRQDSSKETAGSGSVPSIQRQPTNGTLEGGESVMSSHLSLNKDEEEEEEDDLQQVDVSSSSEEEVYKPVKREEDALPLFMQEERKRLLGEAQAIGYRKQQVMRVLRDGVPSSSMDVLVDNILYSGYGKMPSFKDAATTALPDDMPLPWNPFSSQIENEKKVKQRDDELEDYNAQLLSLARPETPELTRQDVLAGAGIFQCQRSRISPLPPPGVPATISAIDASPSTSDASGSPSAGLVRAGSSASVTSRSLRNPEDEEQGDAARRVEEAARRLRTHIAAVRTKSREGSEWPSIKEEDERLLEAEERPGRFLGSPPRSATKLSSSSPSSKAEGELREVLLE